jgi:hypothetical protein
MTRRRTRLQREFESLNEGLGKLDAIAGLLKEVARPKSQDVIELEEVSPGVYAQRTQQRKLTHVGNVPLISRVHAVLTKASELEERARKLATEKPWKQK